MSKPKKDPAEEWIKRLNERPQEDEGEDYPISLPAVLLIILGGILLLGLLVWMAVAFLF